MGLVVAGPVGVGNAAGLVDAAVPVVGIDARSTGQEALERRAVAVAVGVSVVVAVVGAPVGGVIVSEGIDDGVGSVEQYDLVSGIAESGPQLPVQAISGIEEP